MASQDTFVAQSAKIYPRDADGTANVTSANATTIPMANFLEGETAWESVSPNRDASGRPRQKRVKATRTIQAIGDVAIMAGRLYDVEFAEGEGRTGDHFNRLGPCRPEKVPMTPDSGDYNRTSTMLLFHYDSPVSTTSHFTKGTY